jgi:hypothetical protein
MKVHTDLDQGSLLWHQLRAGKITASEADALVTPLGKVKEGDGPKTYLFEKLAERWTGLPLPQIKGIFDMEQGEILESYAKPSFVLETGREIGNVGFIESEDGFCGCSPDGFAQPNPFVDIGVEIKCPKLETHIRYLLDGGLPKQYVAQVQFSMFVTGFEQWHFYSYRRRMPNLHLIIERDEDYQSAIRRAVDEFKIRFDLHFEKLCEINGGPPPRRAPLPPDANRAHFDEEVGITP